MAPSGEDAFPSDLVSDGLATVDRDGALAAQNAAMRAALAAMAQGPPIARLAELPVPPGERDRLLAGEPVSCGAFELRLATRAGVAWLVARDTAAVERWAAERLASARARLLGGYASTIVHDLANLLGAGLGLAELVRPFVLDPVELSHLDRLAHGTRQGALLARAVARLLAADARSREQVGLRELVDEVVATVGRNAQKRGIAVTVVPGAAAPSVRIVAADGVHALLQGILFLIEAKAAVVELAVDTATAAIGGGRPRAVARVRVIGRPVAASAGALAEGLLAGTAAMLMSMGQLVDGGSGLVTAALALRCSGGDVRVRQDGGALTFEYEWPAAAA